MSHADFLVTTEWVANNMDKITAQIENPEYRLVETNEDSLLYSSGHVPGAIEIDWTEHLNDPVIRDFIDADKFQELMREKGIANNTTVIICGDVYNWWAAYSFFAFNLFGHTKVKLMDGGRMKWEAEGRELTREVPNYPKTEYVAPNRDDTVIRALRDGVLDHIDANLPLVDVRSPEEFSGERLHIPGYPNEGALRGGHIPGANSIPWKNAVNEDGTFKSEDELRKIYVEENNLDPKSETVVYCRIGERSSHSWFVLKYLLGFDNIRNYDGSWTEWGNLIGVPIAK